jgi:20S proteasome alpha/beta subunit
MTKDQVLNLAIKSLLEVVQSGEKNIEIAIMEKGKNVKASSPTYSTKYQSS